MVARPPHAASNAAKHFDTVVSKPVYSPSHGIASRHKGAYYGAVGSDAPTTTLPPPASAANK